MSEAANTGEVSAGTSDPAPGDIGPISEQDLDQARSSFDAAKATWEGREPFGYHFRSGVESINMIQVIFDADGNAGEETVLFGEADPEGWSYVPRSVDEAFDEIETMLKSFESGEFEVPAQGDCGYHFNAAFDPQLGAPRYYDSLGPCDDGVGIRVEVIPEGAEIGDPAIPAAPCLEADYYGTWLSPRAAGTEPLDPDDGIGDEGGSGVVSLTLADGESSLRSADTIEIIEEWFCQEGEITAIRRDGEPWTLATINDDGTLTGAGQILTRADG